MKARLPMGYGKGGMNNMQQLAQQAQKIQADMEDIEAELDVKEYSASAGGNAVTVTITGKNEIKSIVVNQPEVIDPNDIEMFTDMIIAATNEALRAASAEKEERMTALSGGLSIPGMW